MGSGGGEVKWTSSGLYCLALESEFGVIRKDAGWGTCMEGISRVGEPFPRICLVSSF